MALEEREGVREGADTSEPVSEEFAENALFS